jgi:AcrR family transcriptional regulator
MEQKENRKIRYTRMALRDSLIELMKTHSILRISIKDICDLADISRSTFYTYYKDQYDLLQQIEEETLACFDEMLDKYKDKRGRLELTQMLEELLTYIANNSNSIQVLLSENGDIGFQKKLFRHFTYHKLVTQYLPEKLQGDEIKTFYSVFLINGHIGLIQHWLKNNMPIPVPQLAHMMLEWTKQ